MINHYRIEHAKKILKDSKYRQLNINEIGELSGFSSESSFYRIFKNHENISPGNYRKKHLINH
jgi:AraC-like DNA-binding protein